jgi:hypothetical protein
MHSLVFGFAHRNLSLITWMVTPSGRYDPEVKKTPIERSENDTQSVVFLCRFVKDLEKRIWQIRVGRNVT